MIIYFLRKPVIPLQLEPRPLDVRSRPRTFRSFQATAGSERISWGSIGISSGNKLVRVSNIVVVNLLLLTMVHKGF